MGVTSEWEEISGHRGMLFPLFRTNAVGNFGSCQCPVWLTARCELKDEAEMQETTLEFLQGQLSSQDSP